MNNNKGNLVIVFLIGLIVGFGIGQIGGGETDEKVSVETDSAQEEQHNDKNDGDAMVMKETHTDDPAMEISGDTMMSTSEQKKVDEITSRAAGTNTIVVANQPAGDAVVVSLLSLEKSGWIAIHEDRDGALGNILGARRFNEGQYVAETVKLLRGTVGGATYHAVLHLDDGDSNFNYKTEIPVRDALGSLIAEDFVATAGAGLQ